MWKDRCPRAKAIRGAREETADENAEGWGGCLVLFLTVMGKLLKPRTGKICLHSLRAGCSEEQS